jgi:hypothetical protein
MAFFVPCDDVNIKMYFSTTFLDKYDDCAFSSMYKWEKKGMNVDLYNGGILLYDVDKETLKLIQECLIEDFDINVMIKYLKYNIFKCTHLHGSLVNVDSYKGGVKIALYTDENGYLILNKLNKALVKYIGKTKFKYNNYNFIHDLNLEEFDLDDYITYLAFSNREEHDDKRTQYRGGRIVKENFIANWNDLMESKFKKRINVFGTLI